MLEQQSAASVTLERRGAALWARLNRPGALNGLTPEVADGLDAALDVAAADPEVRALVVAGTGRAFCAGADLKYLQSVEDDPGAHIAFLRRVGESFDRLEAFGKPVIAAVNGVAVAGGLELLLCCDLVVASEDARIGDAHANYGLLPGAGSSVRLARRIGITRAKHLLFTGAMVSATEMRSAGLVNDVVPAEQLEEAVAELVAALATKSPLGLARVKQLANDALESPAAVGLRAELIASELHRHSHDMTEGLAAFAEKRVPRFSGR
jgi:enoyl-CoA hydratase